jgi:phosphopantothenoylcysteine decarboxylase/phosphopantothenate--cysteine ligase
MFLAVKAHINKADIFIASAAVADYHCEKIADQKIKKSADQITLTLNRNPDIVGYVGVLAKPPFVVGFAAETENLYRNAKDKLKNKNLDMVVANLVGVPDSGFNSINNTVSIIDKNSQVDIANKEKTALAFDILRLVEKAL